MTKPNYQLFSVIVCDDIRTEVTGKQSINGIYDGEMLVAEFPALIPKVSFRIAIRTTKRAKKLKIVVESATQKLISYDGDFPKPKLGLDPHNVAFAFAASPALFPSAETYKIKLGIDGPAKAVGEFIVRLPKTEGERERLKV